MSYFKTIAVIFMMCLFAQGAYLGYSSSHSYSLGQVLIKKAKDGSLFNKGKYDGHIAQVINPGSSESDPCYEPQAKVEFRRTTSEVGIMLNLYGSPTNTWNFSSSPRRRHDPS